MQGPVEAARPGSRLALIVRRDVRTARWTGGRAFRGLARDCVEGAERAGVAYAGRRFSLVYCPFLLRSNPHTRAWACPAIRSPAQTKNSTLTEGRFAFRRCI